MAMAQLSQLVGNGATGRYAEIPVPGITYARSQMYKLMDGNSGLEKMTSVFNDFFGGNANDDALYDEHLDTGEWHS
jgi:hypothetical protein